MALGLNNQQWLTCHKNKVNEINIDLVFFLKKF